MPKLSFEDLIEIYRNTRFKTEGEGDLTIVNQRILDSLHKIEGDQFLYDDVQIAASDPEKIFLGNTLRINIAPPKISLGILAKDLGSLMTSRNAVFQEPLRYYLIDESYARGDVKSPKMVDRYRALLEVVDVLRDAASYVDEVKNELVFISPEKTVIPVRFSPDLLTFETVKFSQRLYGIFKSEIHKEEKLQLLAMGTINLTSGLRSSDRFAHIIRNLDHICDDVEKGYRLFISNFSYSKIKSDIEAARHDYLNKIHKTISDIQGQLLGIPIATIVVASQLKAAEQCGAQYWTNAAIVLGAWIFVALLMVAIYNQKHTLKTLNDEIRGQKKRLAQDYSSIADNFSTTFENLLSRISWHQRALNVVCACGFLGAFLTTLAFVSLSGSDISKCVGSSTALNKPETASSQFFLEAKDVKSLAHEMPFADIVEKSAHRSIG